MMITEGAAALEDEATAAAARAGLLPCKKKRVVGEFAATHAAERKKRRAVLEMAPAAAPSPAVDGGYCNYKKIGKIGSGAYGVVYRAEDVRSGEIVAMKCLRPDVVGLDDAFDREVSALEACRGLPCIVQLRNSGSCVAANCRGREAFIIMEFAGRTLSRLMEDEDNGGLKRHAEAEVRRLMRQLLTGAAGMHKLGLIHRDLKPNNVLVDDLGSLKICDLGMSRSTSEEPPYSNPVVTLRYRAPELLLGSTDYDGRIDSWAIGCIMAQLLAGEHLFHMGLDEEGQLSNVLDVLGTDDICSWRGYDGLLPEGCGPESTLRERFPCPEEAARTGRPALSEAGFELLGRLLKCNPDLRMKPARALQHRWFQEE